MNTKGTSIKEVIFIIALLALLVLPFLIFKLWWWFWCFLTIGIVVAVFELVASLVTGKTISQQFWAWSSVSGWKKWVIVGMLILGWAFLILHLVG